MRQIELLESLEVVDAVEYIEKGVELNIYVEEAKVFQGIDGF